VIIKILKTYYKKYQEKKCIAKQHVLEKRCVDHFHNDMQHITDIESIKDDYDEVNDIHLLAKFSEKSFPMQAVIMRIPYEGANIQLYYGSYIYRDAPDWVALIKDFPSERWLSVKDYPRPTCPALLLCDYDTGHYEVVEYENKTWTTELCFPVLPKRYFVLDFLTEKK